MVTWLILKDPKNRYAYANLGVALSRANYHKKALLAYEKVIDDARLVIFTYDATGFLENLVSNKPSISLYPNIYIHLNLLDLVILLDSQVLVKLFQMD